MSRTPVTSSQLASVGYDPTTSRLEIEFLNSKGANPIYEYYNVPAATYQGLMGAESKGRYFREHIKGSFGYKKLT